MSIWHHLAYVAAISACLAFLGAEITAALHILPFTW